MMGTGLGLTKTIYLVHVSEGEYSDRTEWIEAAFFEEEKAKAMVEEKSSLQRSYFSEVQDWLHLNPYPSFDEFAREDMEKKYAAAYSIHHKRYEKAKEEIAEKYGFEEPIEEYYEKSYWMTSIEVK